MPDEAWWSTRRAETLTHTETIEERGEHGSRRVIERFESPRPMEPVSGRKQIEFGVNEPLIDWAPHQLTASSAIHTSVDLHRRQNAASRTPPRSSIAANEARL